ncbi:PIR Superfamily Protein [Plasmodium ovale curtisi]|uniref:PIR Superfamily Protein n=1 Tax=Plasmodium ovale curtisi TaxID=864141 RepID=A0A1A8WKQ6_PLAOA|nr:PIR Superfamily Protein [Plasmodium ovale curtisi]SBT00902.1 PIR Superfamily Protein [Plasmodium ovale curtisi]
MENAERILEKLTKYKLYDKLSKNDYNTSDCGYCNTVKTALSQYNGTYDMCCRFAKNLITLPAILCDEGNSNERCRYFNFWINYSISKIISTYDTDTYDINQILTRFLQVHHQIKSLNKHSDCEFEYDSKNDLKLWNEWKDLYDYIRNYDDIKDIINSDSNLCKLYPEYFNYITKVYKEYKNKCCDNKSYSVCPYSLNFNEWCNMDKIYTQLPCVESKITVTSFSEHETDPSMDGPLVDVMSHSAPPASPEQNNHVTGDVINTNTDYYAKLGISFSFLGIFSTLFYLYNFTEFGNWIRSKVLKQKTDVNLDPVIQDLMEHELNNADENLHNNGYNITYHPS